MIWFKRSLSKCLDLALFGGALHLLFQFLGISLFAQGCIGLLLPIFFAPVEALLFKCFHTTLGKAFFGLSYDRPFTMRSAFQLSYKHSILILPLFLPLINILFAFFYVRELSRFSGNRWDELSTEKLGQHSRKIVLRTIVIAFTLLLTSITFAPKFTLTQMANFSGIEYFIEGVNSSYKKGNIANWKKVDESEVNATLYFPQAPEHSVEKYPVPKSQSKLDLNHYIYKDAAHNYSLTYTTLPASWTKWGSSLVLGVGVNYVVDKDSIVSKKKCKHYEFPALEYKLKSKGKTTTGMLVLVKDQMYKIEFEQSSEIADLNTEAEQDLLNAFFSSFKPNIV